MLAEKMAAVPEQQATNHLVKQPSAAYVWYVILLLAVVNLFNYMDRIAISVLAPAIQADLGLTDSQLGLLTGLSFALFYAICGLPIARLADRAVRKNIIAIALGVWSVMTAVSGAAQNFWHLFLARMGVGAGEAGCIPPGHSIVCDYVPYERRPMAFAIHNAGIFAGLMVGLALGGYLVDIVGWRWTLVILGLPGLLLAALVWFTIREPPRGFYDDPSHATTPVAFREVVSFLWQRKTYVLLVVAATLNGFIQYGLNQWWPSFYVRSHDVGHASLGLALGVAMAVGSSLGIIAGGLVSNKLVHRDVRLPMWVSAVAILLAMPTALASLFWGSYEMSIFLIGLTTFLWSVSNPAIGVVLYSVAPSNMRATAGAIQVFLTASLGFSLGPTLVGLLSDRLAPSLGQEALRYALILPTCGLPVMAGVLWLAARTLAADIKDSAIRA